jgi:hypothetical protein
MARDAAGAITCSSASSASINNDDQTIEHTATVAKTIQPVEKSQLGVSRGSGQGLGAWICPGFPITWEREAAAECS